VGDSDLGEALGSSDVCRVGPDRLGAVEFAQEMLPLGFRHSWLGTEHLFLGAASATDNPSGQVLSSLGMTVASAGQALLDELGPPPSGQLLGDEDERTPSDLLDRSARGDVRARCTGGERG
jgi:hypothetical protein